MKDKIYTIPVTEAFTEDCECPLCLLESRIENHYLEYQLGPSLMEPDCRKETNDKGFCRRHFQMMYNKQENRLGLALMLDTHLEEQLGKLEKAASQVTGKDKDKTKAISKDNSSDSLSGKLTDRLSSMLAKNRSHSRDNEGRKALSIAPETLESLTALLKSMETSCAICDKLNYSMNRYMDVIFHLWKNEDDFRKLFNSKKGFCIKHFKLLLEASEEFLKGSEIGNFCEALIKMQLENLDRIRQETNWFTKKFDYRNNDAPWGNSKDAIPRAIQKLSGYCDLK